MVKNCWKLLKKTKTSEEYETKDGTHSFKYFKGGRSWITTGMITVEGSGEKLTIAPSFYSRKKDAKRVLEFEINKCPRTFKNKSGNIVTMYKD